MAIKYSNKYSSTIDGPIDDVTTTIVVTSAVGLPELGVGDHCYLTLETSDGTVNEIVKVTDIDDETLTVERGQQSTSAIAWDNNSSIELRVTAAGLEELASSGGSGDVVADLEEATITEETPELEDKILFFDDSDSGNLKSSLAEDLVNIDSHVRPFVTMFKDQGRFDTEGGKNTVALTGTFLKPDFFASYNSSTGQDAGKFITNNTTHGGSAGSLTASVDSLITALGRTDILARYGVEFRVLRITAGEGTSSSVSFPSGTKYLLTVNSNQAIFSSSSFCTFVAWVRTTTGTLGINRGPEAKLYKNGIVVPPASPIEISTSDGWTHVRCIESGPTGYSNSFPRFYATEGDVIEIALTGLFPGIVDTGLHKSPLISRGEII